MEQIYFKEVFQYPIKEFQAHLESDSNERIIFSGKFGIGKTQFLRDFFGIENQSELFKIEKYNAYRVSPVNYSIASNEDIIRYIKYDIIIEMLKKDITIDEVKLNLIDTLPGFLIQNIDKVLAGIVYMIPKVGKEIVECFEQIDKLKEKFLKHHDEINKNSGDRIIEYLEKIEAREGSIYENDFTTTIISESISKNRSKKSILIIDDLDRLDPEHLFRILNVFASHFEANSTSGNQNKFNFDKIIFVCDFNNVRNIFHHKYGVEVDFAGYIDKFYSSEIYFFDNRNAVANILKKIFQSVNFKLRGHDDKHYLYQMYFQDDFVADFITILIDQRMVSIRSILKVFKKEIGYHYEKISYDPRNNDVVAHINPSVMQLKVIKDFFGDVKNLKDCLNMLDISEDFLEKHSRMVGGFLYILSSSIHNFYSRQTVFLYKFRDKPIVIDVKRGFTNERFEYAYLFDWDNQFKDDIPGKGNNLVITKDLFKNVMLDSISLLERVGYIK